MELLAHIADAASGKFPALVHPLTLFFALVIGHAIADFPLQGKFIALRKNRHVKAADYTGETPASLWVYCLSAHCLVHSGFVWVAFGALGLPYGHWFAFAEFVLHWLLDFAKCEKWTNFHVDQACHVLCKAAYVAILFSI